MISGGNIGGDTEEDDNLLTTSSFRNETPTCCIPQPQGIRIIGVISCVSGLFITCLTFLCMHLHGKDEEGLGKVDPTRYLLFTGLSSALVSIWLLCKETSMLSSDSRVQKFNSLLSKMPPPQPPEGQSYGDKNLDSSSHALCDGFNHYVQQTVG
ncbi:hypothetical protein Fcan01_02118 [Folsomia candida]|uniref:Transmembrane protein n=1 Tax=Folsomia candida TaxID=158441 RepID=A0A226EVP6_FOLCA|nr:hypothetical protein Fcan01_02118 [Folsomia candida]